MTTTPPDWADLGATLAALPRRALVCVAVRAAARVVPLVTKAELAFGPEAIEWANALDAATAAAAAFAAGKPVSGFTLAVAAELARVVPQARVNRSRVTGVSTVAGVEELEHVCAAVAYAVDAARVQADDRAVRLAGQAVSLADGAFPGAGRLSAFDAKVVAGFGTDAVDPSGAGPLGELWPAGEPDWFAGGVAKLRAARDRLPRVLEL